MGGLGLGQKERIGIMCLGLEQMLPESPELNTEPGIQPLFPDSAMNDTAAS